MGTIVTRPCGRSDSESNARRKALCDVIVDPGSCGGGQLGRINSMADPRAQQSLSSGIGDVSLNRQPRVLHVACRSTKGRRARKTERRKAKTDARTAARRMATMAACKCDEWVPAARTDWTCTTKAPNDLCACAKAAPDAVLHTSAVHRASCQARPEQCARAKSVGASMCVCAGANAHAQARPHKVEEHTQARTHRVERSG